MEELARAAEIIGYHEVVMLGYRDSGMAGTEANADPAASPPPTWTRPSAGWWRSSAGSGPR